MAAVFAAHHVRTVGVARTGPAIEPPWPSRVQGMAFSPFYSGQDPVQQVLPSRAQIEADLQLLPSKVKAVRTYSSLETLGARSRDRGTPQHQGRGRRLARPRPRDQRAGSRRRRSSSANAHSNVIRLVIGNEAILRGDLTVEELARELDRVRAAVDQPVSTAEPWHVWLSHPELAEHVDFITVHLLPVLGRHRRSRQAVDYLALAHGAAAKSLSGQAHRHRRSRLAFGRAHARSRRWPRRATRRCSCVASSQRAREEGYVYYIMEAFDQPWKARYEGAVGAYWGVYDVERQPKFEFVEPIVRIPEWQMLARISVVARGVAARCCSIVHSRTLGTRGRSLLALVVYAAATAAVWIVYDYSQQYLTLTSMLIGTLLIVGMLGVIAVLLAEAHEWAEARWVDDAPPRVLAPANAAPSQRRKCRSTCRPTTSRRTW